MEPVIFVADIGSVRKKPPGFGWARGYQGQWTHGKETADAPQALADAVAAELLEGRPVALGFEAPMWVPIPVAAPDLGRRRRGEHNRSWSAQGGACALTTGLAQVVWVLRHVGRRVSEARVEATLQVEDFHRKPAGRLLLWEALVTDTTEEARARTNRHCHDAECAGRAFEAMWRGGVFKSALGPEEGDEIYSLLGAALLRTGWTTNVALLVQAPLVVRGWP